MENQSESTGKTEKRFPCFHQLILKNDIPILITDAYQIPEKEKGCYNIIPVILLCKQEEIEKTTKRISLKHATTNLTQIVPESLKEYCVGGFGIDQDEMKIYLLEELHGREFTKPQKDTDYVETAIDAISTIEGALKAAYKIIKAALTKANLFRNKDIEEALERFHCQQKILYLYLLQNEPATILFWKNHKPTLHILLNEEEYTHESLAKLFYSQGQGVGTYSNFLTKEIERTEKIRNEGKPENNS